jgi:alcohol dehydrogenase class IV
MELESKRLSGQPIHASSTKKDSKRASSAHLERMPFEFATATRIIFGRQTIQRLPTETCALGKRALIVTGRDASRLANILSDLEKAGCETRTFAIAGEPTIQDIELGATQARSEKVELIIAIGGGSAVDAGKAIAAMACQPEPLLHYLEVIGQGQPLQAAPLPFIAVPTTAGTGAEVTRNAVLASPEHGVKASLRHARMLPTLALIDPELARSCPPDVTAASGMDALTQCLEAYLSIKAQPLTDALCVEGIQRAMRSLERAVRDGDDLDAREDLALAALFSGMALANAGLGAVHGFAAPLGGLFKAPHGAVCAALLAPVWQANWAEVQRSGTASQRQRFHHASQLLGAADPEEAGTLLQKLTQRLHIPGLRRYGLQESDLDAMAEKAARASSMKGNPVALSHATLVHCLKRALDQDAAH